MNEMCSIDSHILFRFQFWIDLESLQPLHLWQYKVQQVIITKLQNL